MNCSQLDQLKKNRGALIALFGLIAGYTIIMGTWAINRYMSFHATLWDMGLMLQAIWNTTHGRILHETVNLGFSASRLAVAHWEIIYLPLALIYRIIPSIPMLLCIQTLILACGIIPIFKLATKKLTSPLAGTLIALAYLFYPALHGANLFDLHGLTLATTFLLFAFYYLDQAKLAPMLISAVLSMACREDVALVIFSLGLFAWIKKGQRRMAIPLVLLSTAWLAAFFLRFHFFGAPEMAERTSMVPNWEHLSLNNFIRSPIQTIAIIVRYLLSQENIKYLAKLALPVIGLCFLSIDILLIAAPTLLLNLLSQWPQMHQIEYHYTATITPFIFLAAIQGLANLKERRNKFFQNQTHRLTVVLSAAIALAAFLSMTQFSIVRFHRMWQVSEPDRKLSQQLRAISAHLSVSTTARAGSHLANRRELYHFPERSSEADVIVLELNRPEIEIKNLAGTARTLKVPAMNELTRAALHDTTLAVRWVENNVFCLQRRTAQPFAADQFFILDTLPNKMTAVNKRTLHGALEFLGWQPVYIGKRQAHLLLYWKRIKPVEATVTLNFYLKAEDVVQIIPHQPLFGRAPLSDWPIDKIVVDHLFIDRPDNLAMQTHSVFVSVSLGDSSQLEPLFDFSFQ